MSDSSMAGGGENPPPASPSVELRGINKSFGAVHANKDIDLTVSKGSITGIIGENGAGKSTLVSILYGFYSSDSGKILIDGKTVKLDNTATAIQHGIGMVHQHFMLVSTFTVLENIMLGSEGSMLLQSGEEETRRQLKKLSEAYGLDIDPDALVGDLPVGLQQRVEILKALRRGARILILDEPTGVLTPQEANRLFEILRTLSNDGVTILLITHKLREIMAVTDHVAVMRHGEMVASRTTSQSSKEELARLMVGRDVLFSTTLGESTVGDVMFSVQNINSKDAKGAQSLKNISFEIKAGEILGIAGVSGNGQSELLEVLSGITPIQEGRINFAGNEITAKSPIDPSKLREMGLGHIPEDRHERGLILQFTAAECAILGYHNTALAGPGFLLDEESMHNNCVASIEQYDIRPADPNLKSGGFSGGNQQKIVVARELNADPKVLLVGQPTRGVDIGAIEFIHQQLMDMRDKGCAILLISVELDEILTLSDRVLVINNGQIVGEANREEADPNRIGMMMAGIDPGEAA